VLSSLYDVAHTLVATFYNVSFFALLLLLVITTWSIRLSSDLKFRVAVCQRTTSAAGEQNGTAGE
jgi:hypothetical protein